MKLLALYQHLDAMMRRGVSPDAEVVVTEREDSNIVGYADAVTTWKPSSKKERVVIIFIKEN